MSAAPNAVVPGSHFERGGLEHGGLEHGGLEHDGLEHGGLEHGGLEHGGLEHGGLEHGGLEHGGLAPNDHRGSTVGDAALVRRYGRVGQLTFGLPLLGAALAVAHAARYGVHGATLLAALGYYVLSVLGLELGYHRHFTHRSFVAPSWLRYALGYLGATGASGPVIYWAATHRLHHSRSDRDGDPHSPYNGQTRLKGLWHAQVGWILKSERVTVPSKLAPDLIRDAVVRRIDRYYWPIALAGVVGPFLVGGVFGGGALAVEAGLWVGLFRLFAVQTLYTGALNSLCHWLGSRDFETIDRSTNNPWLVFPTLGQSLHNTHHAFPRAAILGLRWFELDPSGWVVSAFERFGVVSDVRRANPLGVDTKRKVYEK